VKATIIFTAVLLFIGSQLNAQTRTIYGRVIIDDDLLPIPGVRIQTPDKLIVGNTDNDGKFKISIPQNTQTLLLNWIGLEQATIKLNNNCDTVEIVMMTSGTYDFMSSSEVDRLRLKWFNKLPALYLQAYNKGLFAKQSSCYSREFEPAKTRLDEYEKERIKKEKEIKLKFKRLNIGDTIKIPFGAQYRYDGTDRTTLTVWSASTNERNFDGVLKCVIIDKNKHKRGYNLVCKVVDASMFKSPSVYRDRVMKVGEVFTYNMKYFKILDE